MAIRIAHGLTPALSGAAGFFSGKEREKDRRGSAAASAANQSISLKQRKREFDWQREKDAASMALQEEKFLSDSMNQQISLNQRQQQLNAPKGSPPSSAMRPQQRLGSEPSEEGVPQENVSGMPVVPRMTPSRNLLTPRQQLAPSTQPVVPQRQFSNQQTPATQSQPAAPVVAPEMLAQAGGNVTAAAPAEMPAEQGGRGLSSALQGNIFGSVLGAPTYESSRGQLDEMERSLAQMELTPKGDKIRGKLLGSLDAAKKAGRGDLRPDGYSQLVDQVKQDFDQSNIGYYVQKPHTLDDEIGSRFKDMGTGYGLVEQPDGKIQALKIDDRAGQEGGVASKQAPSDTMKGTMEWATERAKSFTGSGDEPIANPVGAKPFQGLHEGAIPSKSYTPKENQRFDSQVDANLWAAKMKADGWNVQVVPGKASSESIKRPDGSGRASSSQEFHGIATKPRVLSHNDMIDDRTLSVSEFADDPKRREAAMKKIMSSSQTADTLDSLGPYASDDQMRQAAASANVVPKEKEVVEQIKSDYQDYLQSRKELKQDAKWREPDFDQARFQIQQEMSPSKGSFYRSNWRQTEMALYGEHGRFPAAQDVRNQLDSEWQSRVTDPDSLRKMEFIHDEETRERMAGHLGDAMDSTSVTEALDRVWRKAHPSATDMVSEAINNPELRGEMSRRLMNETGHYPTEQVLREAIADSVLKQKSPQQAAPPTQPQLGLQPPSDEPFKRLDDQASKPGSRKDKDILPAFSGPPENQKLIREHAKRRGVAPEKINWEEAKDVIADDAFLKGDTERQTVVGVALDQALQADPNRFPALNKLKGRVKTDAVRLIDADVLSWFTESGSKNPVDDTAKAIMRAMDDGDEHISTLPAHLRMIAKTQYPVIHPYTDEGRQWIKSAGSGARYLTPWGTVKKVGSSGDSGVRNTLGNVRKTTSNNML